MSNTFNGVMVKNIRLSLIVLILNVWCSFAFAHGEVDKRILIEPESTSFSAGLINYKFQLVDTDQNKLIEEQDLAISHEKKLHLLIYDTSLNEFQHVHPVFDGKSWLVSAQVSVNGEYWVWAQGELASDGTEFSSPAKFLLSSGSSAWPTPPVLPDVRSGQSGVSKVNLSSKKVTAGKMAMLDLTMTRTNGSTPQLTPYIGAFAHVISTPEDGDSLIHVHPVSTGPNQGMLHATFPSKGTYRIWVQYIDGGNLIVIPLAVQVF